MNKLLPIGCSVSSVLVALTTADPDIASVPWIFWPLVTLPLLQIIGTLMISAGARQAGAYTVLVGALPMIPAGIVSALGARRTLDELATERFERSGVAH